MKFTYAAAREENDRVKSALISDDYSGPKQAMLMATEAKLTTELINYLQKNIQTQQAPNNGTLERINQGKIHTTLHKLKWRLNPEQQASQYKLSLIEEAIDKLKNYNTQQKSLDIHINNTKINLQNFALGFAIQTSEINKIKNWAQTCMDNDIMNKNAVIKAIAAWSASTSNQTMGFKHQPFNIPLYQHLPTEQQKHLFYRAAQYGNLCLIDYLSHFLSNFYNQKIILAHDGLPPYDKRGINDLKDECCEFLSNMLRLAVYNGCYNFAIHLINSPPSVPDRLYPIDTGATLANIRELIGAIEYSNVNMVVCLYKLLSNRDSINDKWFRQKLEQFNQQIPVLSEDIIACALNNDYPKSETQGYQLTKFITQHFPVKTKFEALQPIIKEASNDNPAYTYLRHVTSLELLEHSLASQEYTFAALLFNYYFDLTAIRLNQLLQSFNNVKATQASNILRFTLKNFPEKAHVINWDNTLHYAKLFIDDFRVFELETLFKNCLPIDAQQAEELIYYAHSAATTYVFDFTKGRYTNKSLTDHYGMFATVLWYTRAKLFYNPDVLEDLFRISIVRNKNFHLGMLKHFLELFLEPCNKRTINELAHTHGLNPIFDEDPTIDMYRLDLTSDDQNLQASDDYLNSLINTLNQLLAELSKVSIRLYLKEQVYANLLELKLNARRTNIKTSAINHLIAQSIQQLNSLSDPIRHNESLDKILNQLIIPELQQQQLKSAIELDDINQVKQLAHTIIPTDDIHQIRNFNETQLNDIIQQLAIWAAQSDNPSPRRILSDKVYKQMSLDNIWLVWQSAAYHAHTSLITFCIDFTHHKLGDLDNLHASSPQLSKIITDEINDITQVALERQHIDFVINLYNQIPQSIQPCYKLLSLSKSPLMRAAKYDNGAFFEGFLKLANSYSKLPQQLASQIEQFHDALIKSPEKYLLQTLIYDASNKKPYTFTNLVCEHITRLTDSSFQQMTWLKGNSTAYMDNEVDTSQDQGLSIKKQLQRLTSKHSQSDDAQQFNEQFGFQLALKALLDQELDFFTNTISVFDWHNGHYDNQLINCALKQDSCLSLAFIRVFINFAHHEVKLTPDNGTNGADLAIKNQDHDCLNLILQHIDDTFVDNENESEDDVDDLYVSMAKNALGHGDYQAMSIILLHKTTVDQDSDDFCELLYYAIQNKDPVAIGVITAFAHDILDIEQQKQINKQAQDFDLPVLFSLTKSDQISQQRRDWTQPVEMVDIPNPTSTY